VTSVPIWLLPYLKNVHVCIRVTEFLCAFCVFWMSKEQFCITCAKGVHAYMHVRHDVIIHKVRFSLENKFWGKKKVLRVLWCSLSVDIGPYVTDRWSSPRLPFIISSSVGNRLLLSPTNRALWDAVRFWLSVMRSSANVCVCVCVCVGGGGRSWLMYGLRE
jgi:hypothetical protein